MLTISALTVVAILIWSAPFDLSLRESLAPKFAKFCSQFRYPWEIVAFVLFALVCYCWLVHHPLTIVIAGVCIGMLVSYPVYLGITLLEGRLRGETPHFLPAAWYVFAVRLIVVALAFACAWFAKYILGF